MTKRRMVHLFGCHVKKIWMSYRLLSSYSRGSVRNPSCDIFIEIPHGRIALLNQLNLLLSAHVLYLLFPDDCTTAVVTELEIYEPMNVVFGGETSRIEVVLMLIDSSYKVICYPDIERWPGIGHNVYE